MGAATIEEDLLERSKLFEVACHELHVRPDDGRESLASTGRGKSAGRPRQINQGACPDRTPIWVCRLPTTYARRIEAFSRWASVSCRPRTAVAPRPMRCVANGQLCAASRAWLPSGTVAAATSCVLCHRRKRRRRCGRSSPESVVRG